MVRAPPTAPEAVRATATEQPPDSAEPERPDDPGRDAPIEIDDRDPVGDPFGAPELGHPQAMPDDVEEGWERTDPTKGEAPSG